MVQIDGADTAAGGAVSESGVSRGLIKRKW